MDMELPQRTRRRASRVAAQCWLCFAQLARATIHRGPRRNSGSLRRCQCKQSANDRNNSCKCCAAGGRHQPTRSSQSFPGSCSAHRDGNTPAHQPGATDRTAHSTGDQSNACKRRHCSRWSGRRSSKTISSLYFCWVTVINKLQHSYAPANDCGNAVGISLLIDMRGHMDFLILIKNGCDNLTATVAPSIDSLGLHMVWRLPPSCSSGSECRRRWPPRKVGQVQRGKVPQLLLLITFAYCFVRFYDGSIPGIGYSLKGFISGGTSSLVDYIGSDSTQEVQDTIHTALAKSGTLYRHPSLSRTHCFALIQFKSF